MDIKIREALPADAEGIQEVFYRTWLATYPNEQFGITVDDIENKFHDRNSKEKLAKLRDRVSDCSGSDSERYLVALDADQIIGLAFAKRTEKENRLNAIYILPTYQGKGIGASLWKEVLKFFDLKKETLVNVASYNQRAINFYIKLGFTDTGRRLTEERLRMKSGVLVPEIEMRLENHRGAATIAAPRS